MAVHADSESMRTGFLFQERASEEQGRKRSWHQHMGAKIRRTLDKGRAYGRYEELCGTRGHEEPWRLRRWWEVLVAVVVVACSWGGGGGGGQHGGAQHSCCPHACKGAQSRTEVCKGSRQTVGKQGGQQASPCPGALQPHSVEGSCPSRDSSTDGEGQRGGRPAWPA